MAEATIALDADALSAWIRGEIVVEGVAPALPAPVVYEACYGWMLDVGKANQRRREDLAAAYLNQLAALIEFIRSVPILRYTAEAQALFRSLRTGRGNRGTSDLRIAAICIAHAMPLLTRNRSDFADIPGLVLLDWDSYAATARPPH